MSTLTPSARNMIEMMQEDRILLQPDVLPNLIIIFGENLRRQQSIEKHPFEKENYIMLLLTIRSFSKTIISNSFFGKLTQSICKGCPTDKCFQGCPLPELCDHMGELFSEAMHRIS